MDFITDSNYDILKYQLEKTLNDTEKLKSKLQEIHSQKEEENLNKVEAIKDSIRRSTNRLIHLVRANEKRLMNEAMNIEIVLNNNLNEIISQCKKSLLEAKIKQTKAFLNTNELSELQLKKMTNDFSHFNSELAFQIDRIAKFDNDLFAFESSNEMILIGFISEKLNPEPNDDLETFFMKKGMNLCEMRRFEEAVKYFDRSLELNPNNLNCYEAKGNALTKMNQLRNALECYDKAIENNAKSAPGLMFKKGLIYKDLKEFEKSLESFDNSIALNPNFDMVHFNKGNLMFELKMHEKAIECFNKCIQLNPNNNPAFYLSKGLCLYHSKEYSKAIDCLNKSIEIDPLFALTYSSKGLVFYELKDYVKSLECFEKAIQLEPLELNYQNWKAAVFIKLREYERALDCYEAAIRIDPDNVARESRQHVLNELI